MKFGLTKDQYNYVLNTIVKPLRAQSAIVYCYGSRARGDQKNFSDLDLMVESKLNLKKEIALMKEELSNSNFPFKVDIVLLNEFAPSYLDGYQKDKVIF